jgi:hypothetical protein
MRLLSPHTLTDCASAAGFALQTSRTIALSSGKEFALQVFKRQAHG